MTTATRTQQKETPAKATTDTFRLARFISLLALDPAKLALFLFARELAMNDADLTERERDFLRTENFTNLCNYLWEVGDKPIVEVETGG